MSSDRDGAGRPDSPQELFYTFGNHMHSVDMEWLWGYFVLPASVRDMLEYCRRTGTRGNVNFDAVGYERLAIEAPDALAELRSAVEEGHVEIVGGSYAQPYGLFQGGESNIRHLVYGVRAVLRLFGRRPVTFWEEEFYFFPQLPQLLAGAGYTYASLYFQWTWHTPTVPKEKSGAVYWEGMDGTRILTATRNDLNIHQWPEDFRQTLDSPLLSTMRKPVLVQWLELMPSEDWMCRSELLAPEMERLKASDRFTVRPVTLSQYLEEAKESAPPRRYGLQEVFHGMSLGKNGDLIRRLSRRAEDSLLAAESVSLLGGYLGRPYPSWDVYPTWELEEAWRNLLTAQHHDIDECEGLCGHVGIRYYEHSLALSGNIRERTLRSIAGRLAPAVSRRALVYNPLGWRRNAVVPIGGRSLLAKELPAFGYRAVGEAELSTLEPAHLADVGGRLVLSRGELTVSVEKESGLIVSFVSGTLGELVVSGQEPGRLRIGDRRAPLGLQVRSVEGSRDASGEPVVLIRYASETGSLDSIIALAAELPAVEIVYTSEGVPMPDPTMAASLAVFFPSPPSAREVRFLHDHPYGVSEITRTGRHLRKYPTGDWMTSPQTYEEVQDPFTALTFFDISGPDGGLQVIHDGSQAQFFAERGVWTILSMNDPWDEDYFVRTLSCRFRLLPHGRTTPSALWKRAQEFRRGVETVELSPACAAGRAPALSDSPAVRVGARSSGAVDSAAPRAPTSAVPAAFELLCCDAPGVAVTAAYRETPDAKKDLPTYAPARVLHPIVIRLVELDGVACRISLCISGKVESSFRTNLLGELKANEVPHEVVERGEDGVRTRLTFEMGAHEIVTLYLDVVEARKQSRRLDGYRGVWATAHRVESG